MARKHHQEEKEEEERQKSQQYAQFLAEKGELPLLENAESRLQKEIAALYETVTGSGNVLFSLLSHKGPAAQKIQDYFYKEEGQNVMSRRITDIAEDNNLKQSTVTKAVGRLEGVLFFRPKKPLGSGRLVSPYNAILDYLYERRKAGFMSHNVTPGWDFRVMKIGALRSEFSGSDWATTHGIELTYLPELVNIAPPHTDVLVDWDENGRGFSEVVLKSDSELSSGVWKDLITAVRVQTRGIVTRMCYDPDTKTVIESHKLPNRVIERIDPPHGPGEGSCRYRKRAHFKVNADLALTVA